MKKKCVGCIALQTNPGSCTCSLGHEIDYYKVSDFFMCPKPKEECPKPTTYVQYFAAMRKKGMSSDGVK